MYPNDHSDSQLDTVGRDIFAAAYFRDNKN